MRMVQYDKHEAVLGDGGFGTVYAATLGGTRVVVKKLNNQNVRPQLLEGMRMELEAYQQLQVCCAMIGRDWDGRGMGKHLSCSRPLMYLCNSMLRIAA